VNPIKKTIYTLCVDGYAPEITAITFPLLKAWATKIGAEVCVIDKRLYNDWPPVYEKFQIYDAARKNGDDWSIYVDADALIYPEMPDPTNHIPKYMCLHNASDVASIRWRYDEYFLRDGRNIAGGNWFTVASDWCRDIWHPLEDMTLQQAVKRITVTVQEHNFGMKPEHLIDDYVTSRNIARYGLKFTTLRELWKKLELVMMPDPQHLLTDSMFHVYTETTERKVEMLLAKIKEWRLAG
jgi:hypothetical protein